MRKSVDLKQRKASGIIFVGVDCEYIRLGSVILNDGCTDGKDENFSEDESNDDEFREQVCNQARSRSEEAVSDPEWCCCSWFCHQRKEVC